jgi:hypothetical protein
MRRLHRPSKLARVTAWPVYRQERALCAYGIIIQRFQAVGSDKARSEGRGRGRGQKRSTTTLVLNGVFGGGKQGLFLTVPKTRVFGTDELRFCGQIWRYFEMRML